MNKDLGTSKVICCTQTKKKIFYYISSLTLTIKKLLTFKLVQIMLSGFMI